MKVNLDSWTAYYAVRDREVDTENENATLLLESHRPSDVDRFFKETFAVPQSECVHVCMLAIIL